MLRDPLPAIYAIGDVHGCLDELRDAENRIVADAEPIDGPKLIVLLGDIVDRGPRSAAVLDHLIAPPPPGFRRLCLAGNHDDTMESFVRSPSDHLEWLEYGGDATLRSYGIDVGRPDNRAEVERLARTVRETVPAAHLRFLAQLPVFLATPGHLFVHAGVEPGIALEDQTDETLMWIREPFLTRGPCGERTVVHGHTPNPQPVFGPSRICIDTGAYVTGRLTVLRLADGAAEIVP